MEKMEIKEYLQKMLDRWNKYDELDGFVAENFRVDLEKTLEYWDLRIADNKEELDKAREEGKNIGWKDCEKFYKDLRSILRPYHQESEDYRTTLKRLLSKLKAKEDEK